LLSPAPGTSPRAKIGEKLACQHPDVWKRHRVDECGSGRKQCQSSQLGSEGKGFQPANRWPKVNQPHGREGVQRAGNRLSVATGSY
jgi:hypothetical protein